MLNRADDELLTRVESGTAMGAMLRLTRLKSTGARSILTSYERRRSSSARSLTDRRASIAQASAGVCERRRRERRMAAPTRPKPTIIRAQVCGSGTGARKPLISPPG